MLALSPSPESPMPLRRWSANKAPVATGGMRPCRPLKPNERLRKYVGDLLEQPIPLNLTTFSGTTFISYKALMIWFEIELCPQPWQSVLGAPRYSLLASPARFTWEGAPAMGSVSAIIVAPQKLCYFKTPGRLALDGLSPGASLADNITHLVTQALL